MLREAAALSGVPVKTIFACLVWCAQARTVNMVEVVSIKARVCRVLNALARLGLYIIDRVWSHRRAIKRNASATASNTVPVKAFGA